MERINMIEYILMFIVVVGSILALMQRDLLKAAIITGVPGVALAFLYQYLLAPDVALTQAIVGSAIVPVFIALAVYKTRRVED
jgi:energy-converting hydrogenase B subunit D